MTEQQLIDLGFIKEDIPMEESGFGEDFHYYTLEIGDICLISNSSDLIQKENDWLVQIFNHDSPVFYRINELQTLIKVLKNNIS